MFVDDYKMKLLNFNEDKRREWEEHRQPYSVHFELTPKCNMNCVHCYLQKHHQFNQMSYERIIEILDILYDKGILFITFTGGEIFTRSDFLDIYIYAKKKGFLVELFTNGYHITDKAIEVFKKYPPILVDISLYGACEETYYKVTGVKGAYKKVVENTKKLIDAKIRVAYKSPIITLTLDEMCDMEALAKSLGIECRFSFEIITTIDKDDVTKQYEVPRSQMLEYEFKDYYTHSQEVDERIKEDMNKPIDNHLFNCKIGRDGFLIDYEGKMNPCMKFRHKGHILTRDTFDDIWHEFGEYSKLKAGSTFKCLSCDSKHSCDVCSAEMDFLYGNMEARPSPVCTMAKIRKAFYVDKLSLDDALKLLDEEVNL